jgi:protein SCO1/2
MLWNVTNVRTHATKDKMGKTVKPSQRRNLGLIFVVAGLVIVILAGLIVTGTVRINRASAQLSGATIEPPFPAPNFELHDQFDQPISLSSYKGKVVALTFLYTTCPDACPLITEKLHSAYDQLGPDASKFAIIAVTVDPAHDTVAQVRNYSVQKDMLQKWHFLVGPDSAIRPVLALYGVDSVSEDDQAVAAKSTAVALALPSPTPLPVKGVVDHASPTFIVDPLGRARAILDVNFAPADLVQNVRALLAE